MSTKTTGSVLVIGGGIAGVQAALDLAESGFKVYLVEKSPSIGGTMAQLDKTFPTNDCSLCILSPKLVDVGRHPNIELLTNSGVEEVSGDAGNFTVKVNKKARYVTDACVGCGLCAGACVLKDRFENEFDEGLKKRSAIYIPFAQAVPLQYIVDKDRCLFLTKGKCSKKCQEACPAGAVDLSQEDEMLEINVGSVIIASGFDEFDATKKYEYGCGRYDNVVTSIEFERMMCASGPTGGIVKRPSDGAKPKKIGFIHCVGSRDEQREYCSSVCCMYTTKEAIIVKEHQDVECSIFYIDMRSFGKDFDQYIERAKTMGIRYHRAIPSVEQIPGTKNLLLNYETEEGNIESMEVDLLVLAVGLCPPGDYEEISKKIGIELNKYNFCKTTETAPVETSRDGVFVCGAFSGPKDIPETVTQASGAVSKAMALLSDSRGEQVSEKEYLPEIEIGDEARVGVFVCHCGINIGSVVDVPGVADYARTLPGVVYATENIYSCSQDTQDKIKEGIKEHNLNRVVVAACTPRTHESLFRETMREAGLNPYLFEMANIRDHCSWVHPSEPEKATEKARDLVKMAVAKINLSVPLKKGVTEVIKSALVLGGGVSGMVAALEIANQGYSVTIVEQDNEPGGNLKKIHYTLSNPDTREYLNDLIKKINNNKLISVFTGTKIRSIDGCIGNFTAITEGGQEIKSGVIVVATGASEYKPNEFMYGKDERIMTQIEFEEKLSKNEIDPRIKNIVMVQCVGSRNDERPYCSRICCYNAVKNALKVKQQNPAANVFILYRDIRTYGMWEKYYKQAREKGVIFMHYKKEKQPIVSIEGGNLKVEVEDQYLGGNIEINPDALILSSAVIPRDDAKSISEMLKVPLTTSGFFLEAHAKLRPVDFATEGIFLCGMAHSPKLIDESISQALAAAARASIPLAKGFVETEAISSEIDPEKCIACGNCIPLCPYGALSMKREGSVEKHTVEVNPLLCKGCGTCAAICPVNAINMKNFTVNQITGMIKAALENLPQDEPRIVGFLCNWCSYAGADNAGVSRFEYPPNMRAIRVMCSGRVEPEFIYHALLLGADGVLVGGCHINDCHYISGNVHAEKRIRGGKGVKDYVKDAGLEPERVRLEWVSAAEGQRFADVVESFTEDLKKLGPNPLKLKRAKVKA